jgi:hypothetical protein
MALEQEKKKTTSTTLATQALDCPTNRVKSKGYDYVERHAGNQAWIYVNTSSTLSNLQDSDARSLFVESADGSGDNVEVGWVANDGGYQAPTVYAAWQNYGVEIHPRYYTGYHLDYDSNAHFTVEDKFTDGFFDFEVGGYGFDSSPLMSFSYGYDVTQSEHFNSCDSMWAHFFDLSYYNVQRQWVSPYEGLSYLYCTPGSVWGYHKIDNSEQYVDQSADAQCHG